MPRTRDELAQDYGRRLASKFEEYVLKLNQSALIKRYGFPLDEGQILTGAARQLTYLAEKWTRPPLDDEADDPNRN